MHVCVYHIRAISYVHTHSANARAHTQTHAHTQTRTRTQKGDEQATELNTCNYFQFAGPHAALWDATLNARMAWEGFFTITSGSRGQCQPLPELQPFYGVLTWPNFQNAKHVRAHISKMRRRLKEEQPAGLVDGSAGTRIRRRLRLVDHTDRRECWRLLDEYHKAKNDSNWLTEQYLNMMVAASEDPSINFRMHAICLIEELVEENTGPMQDAAMAPQDAATALPATTSVLAGEIGFSIGRVYTSLSGWTGARTTEAHGTSQLVLLGLWLQVHFLRVSLSTVTCYSICTRALTFENFWQRKGYAFWSLGHCYSPQLEYKRALGHRILPRWDFVRLLRRYRGPFRTGRDCAQCGAKEPETREGAALHKACARCGAVYYCGKACQQAHWKKNPGGHKLECVVAAPLLPQGEALRGGDGDGGGGGASGGGGGSLRSSSVDTISQGQSITAAELL